MGQRCNLTVLGDIILLQAENACSIYIDVYIYTFTCHVFIRRNQTIVFKGKDYMQAGKR